MDTVALALLKGVSERQGYYFIGNHSAVNMCDEKGYASLIRKSKPKSLGINSFSLIWASTGRLSKENMPSPKGLLWFLDKISELINYKVVDYDENARAISLMIEDKGNYLEDE